MTRALVAVDEPRGGQIAAALARADIEVAAVHPAAALSRADAGAIAILAAVDTVILHADRRSLDADVIERCDRAGVRIVALCDDPFDQRLVAGFGLAAALPLSVDGWTLSDAVEAAGVSAGASAGPAPSRVIAVWGATGSPGRSTIAVELAVELARGQRQVALVDADTHAPSLALALGLPDEGPGFAAACRQVDFGGLDAGELTRISIPMHIESGRVDVLTGINRPSRWPELSQSRVAAALDACRTWSDATVVDVAGSLERDEEIVSDLASGPRRNAATLAAVAAADVVVAVVSADPVGVARFLRAYPDLRATVGSAPVAVVANRLRPGALGIDARGQVRRTLERFAGVRDVWFVPSDPRSADAALLSGRPIAPASPRSPLTAAVRRFVGEALDPQPAASERRAHRRSRAPRAPSRSGRERMPAPTQS